jgi:hypothetical protein
MSDFIKLLTTYNLFNNLLPGVIFCAMANSFFSINLTQGDIVNSFFTYYFSGVIIGRLGSIIVEPLLKLLKVVQHEPYSDYVTACKIDSKIELLSEVNNMYRSIISICLGLAIIRIHKISIEAYPFYSNHYGIITIIAIALLFIYSYRKQTSYITKRIHSAIERNL